MTQGSPATASPSGAAASYDLAVVGSGIVGLGHAYAAARRGLSVVVLDRASSISGASIRNFGHLCFTPQHGLARELGYASREIWLRLAREAGFWLRPSGTLVVARHDDELEVLAEASRAGNVVMLDAAQTLSRIPVSPQGVIGGAHLPDDLQVNPRQAAAAISAHLESLGVDFRFRTAVTAVRAGRVETTRGPISAGRIVVAVNHDIDQLYPELAEKRGIRRCGLDMLRVDAGLRAPLEAPLLTGWSLIRYAAFAGTPAAVRLRERLHGERPELAALDLNQMYTQLPDGSLIVGDTHYKGETITPFQQQGAFDTLLAETSVLFGVPRPRVIERWQGVYASAPQEFLVEEPEPGVHLVAVTTGIGMTCGLGLAEGVIAEALGEAPARSISSRKTRIPSSKGAS